MERATVIETQELTKHYHGQIAVDHLSFNVKEGEIFGFLGPNGAGKTTTLLMLLGLTEPSSGSARVAGVDPTRNPVQVKRMIGYLQENMGFYRDLNARQMLRYIAELNGIERETAEQRIEMALEQVGLQQEAKKPTGEFSRGMRQRLGLAEILLKEPKVAFLDEPTLGLDPDATNRMMTLIQQLSQENKMTVLLSSHLLYQAQKICHRVGIMLNGRMVASGTINELAQDKLGVGPEQYTLEEIYMKYFQEA
ncbi:bacitracin transport ATP-binding protein BcrA [Candidatus Vecturithrix granuli]|uniref:Bacitracin transport ATP-binding protein BcrA n=1 Tax=Vecturithrix granuli TaxID=1499967 RepID=A0A081C799_VECG1|nr:bacitracin transport ATP-binding protein BcrA [Candidatus Vecturithrix granuli]